VPADSSGVPAASHPRDEPW